MLRLPSLQREYSYISAADDAIATPPKDADEATRAAFAHRLDVARRTGDYTDVLLEGRVPTKFLLRHIPGDTLRKLYDDANRLGHLEVASLAFRLALVDVSNLDGLRVRHEDHERYGRIAAADVVSVLDSVSPEIVNEVGLYALKRSQGIDPKP